MAKKQVLNDRQRVEIVTYLRDRPWVMPSYVRGLRMSAKSMDFEKMRADLDLLEVLAGLDVRTGRKSNEYKEIHAQFVVE